MNKVVTSSTRETEELGEKFSKDLNVGDVIVLNGELGAGKTVFTRGVSKGLNIKSRVISPTFVLVRKHRGKLNNKKINLYHIDLYRLEGETDIRSLGLDDIFEDVNGIFLIEWGMRHSGLHASWSVNIKILDDNNREVAIQNE